MGNARRPTGRATRLPLRARSGAQPALVVAPPQGAHEKERFSGGGASNHLSVFGWKNRQRAKRFPCSNIQRESRGEAEPDISRQPINGLAYGRSHRTASMRFDVMAEIVPAGARYEIDPRAPELGGPVATEPKMHFSPTLLHKGLDP